MRITAPLKGRRGGTLTELMVATVIMSIGILGLFGAFRFIAKSIFVSRAGSLATNLGQERIEYLKNINYYGLLITTAAATDATVTPNILYDTVNYPKETIAIGGITFTRYTYVTMAELNGTDVQEIGANYPDTGLKQITVNVVWTDQGQRKRWQLKNLLENPNVNPLDATITGTVSNSAGGVVPGAIVSVEQNEDWSGTANAAGTYSFQVYHGTYTVRASSPGFTDAISASQVVARGASKTVNFTLSQFATGYMSGIAWYNNDVVVSQVVAATWTYTADLVFREIEYFELFNPTTFTITIGATNVLWKNISPIVAYRDGGTFCYSYDFPTTWSDDACPLNGNLRINNVVTTVDPYKYYLIANASFFYLDGEWVRADAYYGYDGGALALTYPDKLKNDKPGSIYLWKPNIGGVTDQVGWQDNTGQNPPWYEGLPIPMPAGNTSLGVPPGKQIVRISSPTAGWHVNTAYGRAYDTTYNARDFTYDTNAGAMHPFMSPRTTNSSTFTVITGKPASGAYVSSSDPNSGSTMTYTAFITSAALSLPYAKFQLAGVSTGTWSVNMSYTSGGVTYSAFYDTVTVTQGAFTRVPSSTTVPSWPGTNLPHASLSSSTVSGFVKGTVTNPSNVPLSGITVQGGGSSKTTNSNGQYFMAVTSGTVVIIANPNNANQSYVQSIQSVSVTEGSITTQDFSLSLGGRLTGYVTTGTTPLAYQPVVAYYGSGGQAGSGVTDSGGNFTIRNLSTGTVAYTVAPVLESGQDTSPQSVSILLTSTGAVFVATFTVSGAFGNIAGTVSDAAGLVTSGALILASTNTISATPPSVVGSSAPALTPTYMVSSKADGSYTLPVRGGATYYLSVYVPSVAPSGTVSITTKTYSSIVVAPSATTTRNVTIP